MNRRRWFQIHLSTAILMMLAAGIAMWFAAPFFDFEHSPNATAALRREVHESEAIEMLMSV